MKLRALALALTTFLAAPVMADSIDLNLHNDALRFTYAQAIAKHKGLEMDLGWLYNENNSGVDDDVYHIGLNVFGQNWNKRGTFDIGIGGRMIYTSVANGAADVAAIGIGGQVRFSPIHRVGIGLHVYHAPQILSTLDADGYTESAIRLDYQLLPQAFVYVGYRDLQVSIENGGLYEMDKKVHVGFKMVF